MKKRILLEDMFEEPNMNKEPKIPISVQRAVKILSIYMLKKKDYYRDGRRIITFKDKKGITGFILDEVSH